MKRYKSLCQRASVSLTLTLFLTLLSTPMLLAQAKVYAWGSNGAGSLSTKPTLVDGFSSVNSVAAGGAHTLALASDGKVWAWGANNIGQLGDGTSTFRAHPVPVFGLSNVTAIAAGKEFSLALTRDGSVWAWGANYAGQLGNGDTIASPIPVKVTSVSGVIAIAAGGAHALAAQADGTVYAWGFNAWGQLGNGTQNSSTIPTLVSGVYGAAMLAAGEGHSLALLKDGSVRAWGRNDQGQLGIGSWFNSAFPQRVLKLANVVSISAGGSHSLAIVGVLTFDSSVYPDGQVNTPWSWGSNASGQLGDGSQNSRHTPGEAKYPMGTAYYPTCDLLGGGTHTLALRADGSLWAWGANDSGQLGDGTTQLRTLPIKLGLDKVIAISAGGLHSTAVTYTADPEVTPEITDSIAFQTRRRSIWVEKGGVWDAKKEGKLTWDFSHSIGGFFEPCFGGWDICVGPRWFRVCSYVPGFCLGETGASATLASKGEMGVRLRAFLDLGSVSVQCPTRIKLLFPGRGEVAPGQTFTVRSSYEIDGAASSMEVIGPNAGADMDAFFQADSSLKLKAKGFGATLLDADLLKLLGADKIALDRNLVSARAGLENGTAYLRLKYGNKQQEKSWSGWDFDLDGMLKGRIQVPDLAARGGAVEVPSVPGEMGARTDSSFLKLHTDITKIVTSFLPVPLVYSDSWGPFSYKAGLLNTTLDADFRFRQNFKFLPKPRIRLTWRDGQAEQSVEFEAGQSAELTMPTNQPVMQITPTYILHNEFRNETAVALKHGGEFAPITVELKAGFKDFTLLNEKLTPLKVPFLVGTETLPLFTASFPLGGFQETQGTVATVVGRNVQSPVLGRSCPAQAALFIVDDNRNQTTNYDNFETFLQESVPVILIGSRFDADTHVRFTCNGASENLATSYISPTRLMVMVPNKFRLLPGVGRFTVRNQSGSDSNSLDFPIVYPRPGLGAPGPNLWASDPAFKDIPLVSLGTQFIRRPDYFYPEEINAEGRLLQKYWNRLPTSLNASKSLPETFPAFEGFKLDAQGVQVPAPLPTFYWNGRPLTPYSEPIYSGTLPMQVPNSYFERAQVVQVALVSPGPGGGHSDTRELYVISPKPQITQLVPNMTLPGTQGIRLIIEGESLIPQTPPTQNEYLNPRAQGFVADSIVYWNDKPMPTRFVSATRLEADIPAEELTGSIENNTIYVKSPYVGKNTAGDIETGFLQSNGVVFAVRNPRPNIRSLSPNRPVTSSLGFREERAPGQQDENLIVEGQDFTPTACVCINGKPRSTRYVSDTMLAVTLLPEDVALPATHEITVTNPTPGGGVSDAFSLEVVNAKPKIATLFPDRIEARSGETVVAVMLPETQPTDEEPYGYYAGSKVTWNGQERPTEYLDYNILLVTLKDSDLATAGTGKIKVINPAPGGGTSNEMTFRVLKVNVKGVVTLPYCVNNVQPLTFEFRSQQGGASITRDYTLNASGAFAIGDIPAGKYVLAVKGRKWLRKTSAEFTIGSNPVTINLTLIPGDANGDNEVNIFDLATLAETFNTSSNDWNWNEMSDFNCDDSVDIFDLSILAEYFNRVGDN